MRKIQISKVKNIDDLVFTIPDPGVYILSGRNGSGKTTLLAALHRIGFQNAFPNHFKTTLHERKIDFFGDSSITYSIGEKSVTYNYRNSRWTPTPKRHNVILSEFGFPEVHFIAADSKRIEATTEELKPNRIHSVTENVAEKISSILSDPKFKELKYVNTKRGRGNKAFLIRTKRKGQNYFFSEKNFSLGELCVLRLVTALNNIKFNSLILIDEIEMALHPKAQSALYTYLKEVAEERKLTIFFSTHSSSLIKRSERRMLYLLENNGAGKIECIKGVYPAKALGDIAYDDEVNPDFLFFVEDDKAKQMLEHMLNKYDLVKDSRKMFPYCKVLPVGGFKDTIEFLTNSDQVFSDEVKRFAFLDKDVETESISEANQNKKYKFLQSVEDQKQKIKYLPCTPEQGIIEMIHRDLPGASDQISRILGCKKIDLSRITAENDYSSITTENSRRTAKKKFGFIIEEYRRLTGHSSDQCERAFSRYYVEKEYESKGDLLQLLAPIFN